MPVTPQGIAAEKKFYENVDTLKPIVLDYIKENTPVSPTVLVNHFPRGEEHVVREAMWQLLNDAQIQLSPELHLQA